MSQFRPPPRVKSVRKHHMDLVEEHRILNGHYKRLMMAKAVVDTSTPKSFYTNPRKLRQHLKNSRSISPMALNGRSRSVGSLTRPEAFIPSQEDAHRNPGSPIKIIVSPSSTNSANGFQSARVDLRRSMSTGRSAMNRTITIPTTNHASIPRNAPSLSSAIATARRRSISRPYERRHLDGDIAEKHFHYFDQPGPFKPRLLLFNTAESKVAQQTKNYQPPFWKLRLQHLRAAKLGLVNNDRGEAGSTMNAHQQHRMGGDHFGETGGNDDDLLGSPDKEDFSPSVSFRLGRGRISPNTLAHLSPNMARRLLFDKVYQYNEQDEWRFMNEVTRDIIAAQTRSERILFQIFAQSIKRWRTKLPVPRMRILLTRLMDDIQAPKTGILSVYIEEEPRESTPGYHHPRTKDVGTWTAASDDEADKYDDDEYEVADDDDEEIAIESLADEDMEKILRGKDLDDLYERLEERDRTNGIKKKRQSKKSPTKAQRKTSETIEEVDESKRSMSIASEEKSNSKASNKSSKHSGSEASTRKSSDEDSPTKSIVGSDSENETVGQVSDLDEDDDMQRKISDILTNGKKPASRKSSVASEMSAASSNSDEKRGKIQNRARKNSMSSGEYRLDATPPKALSSDGSNVPSARKLEKTGSSYTPPSRELSLKSMNSSKDASPPLSSIKSSPKLNSRRQQWASRGQREMSITKMDSPPLGKTDKRRPTLTDSITAEEVRQKRESFLKKLEDDRRMSDTPSEVAKPSGSKAASTRSSRRSSMGREVEERRENGDAKVDGKPGGSQLERSFSEKSEANRSAGSEHGKQETAMSPSPKTRSLPASPPTKAEPEPEPTTITAQPDETSTTSPTTQHNPQESPKTNPGPDPQPSESPEPMSPAAPPKPKPRRSLSRSSLGMVTPASLNQSQTLSNRVDSRRESRRDSNHREPLENANGEREDIEEKKRESPRVGTSPLEETVERPANGQLDDAIIPSHDSPEAPAIHDGTQNYQEAAAHHQVPSNHEDTHPSPTPTNPPANPSPTPPIDDSPLPDPPPTNNPTPISREGTEDSIPNTRTPISDMIRRQSSLTATRRMIFERSQTASSAGGRGTRAELTEDESATERPHTSAGATKTAASSD